MSSLVDCEDSILTEIVESREDVFQEMDIVNEISPEESINMEITVEDFFSTEVNESHENSFQEVDIVEEILPENIEIDDSAVEDFGGIDVNMILKFDEEQLCNVNLQCNRVVNTGGSNLSECSFERGENSALADLYRREFFCREEVRTRLEPLVPNMWCLTPWEVQPCGSKYKIKLFSQYYYLPSWSKNFPEG